jgi:hypothetical protein
LQEDSVERERHFHFIPVHVLLRKEPFCRCGRIEDGTLGSPNAVFNLTPVIDGAAETFGSVLAEWLAVFVDDILE